MNHSSYHASLKTNTKGYITRVAYFENEDADIEENGNFSSSFGAASEDSSVYSLELFNSDDTLISGITFIENDGTISKLHATEFPYNQPLPDCTKNNVDLVGLKESKKTPEKRKSKKKKKRKNRRKNSSHSSQDKLFRPKLGKNPSTSERTARTATTTKSDNSTWAMLSSRTVEAEMVTGKSKKRRSKLKNKKIKQSKEKSDVVNTKKRKSESKKKKSKSRLLDKESGKKLEPPGKRMTDFQYMSDTLVVTKPYRLARCRTLLAKAA